ncbi:MAG TPA: nuclear transport factor 2 family protein [Candidatus Limnocylindria bacterium]|jgi:ketosteroid isomerase-like protein
MTAATTPSSGAASPATRLLDAMNRHDLEALTECFAPAFVNETPLHPARSFTGNEQVRKNWTQIFAGVPDLRAELLRSITDGGTVWTEWEMRGTRRDGAPHLMRGVSIFGVQDDRFTSVRFYLEPVEQGGAGIDAAVGQQIDR